MAVGDSTSGVWWLISGDGHSGWVVEMGIVEMGEGVHSLMVKAGMFLPVTDVLVCRVNIFTRMLAW